MEPTFRSDYRQQPITSDEAWQQYQQYLLRLETMLADQEDVVRQAREGQDAVALTRARTSLWRLLTKRQGVLDALRAYEQAYSRTNRAQIPS